jgi:hypothetical protein
MTKHSLFAYAIGLQFSAIAPQVVERINDFIANRRWVCPDVWVVNQQRTDEDWELGLNLALPDPWEETPGWYADVEAVVAFCCQLRRDFDQDFTIGIADNRTGCAEDIIEVVSDQPHCDYLRKFIGAEASIPGGN